MIFLICFAGESAQKLSDGLGSWSEDSSNLRECYTAVLMAIFPTDGS